MRKMSRNVESANGDQNDASNEKREKSGTESKNEVLKIMRDNLTSYACV